MTDTDSGGIVTFGHSTLEAEAALDILHRHRVDVLMDIRSHPSSKWPQWRKAELTNWMEDTGITYIHEPRLGGWTQDHLPLADHYRQHGVDIAAYAKGKFPKQRIGVGRSNGTGTKPAWTNQGLWDYQWYMTTDDFTAGMRELIAMAKGERVAIMCAEVLWWKCHRSMVSDALSLLGIDSYHLQPRFSKHDAVPRLPRYEEEVLTAVAQIRRRLQ